MERLRGLILVLAAAVLSAPTAADEVDRTVFVKAFAGVRLGEGRHVEQLVIFPLIADVDPGPLPVLSARRAADLELSEPASPRGRLEIEASNGHTRAVFVLGGTVVTGGHLDRLVARDTLIEGKAQVEIPMLAAEDPRVRRKDPKRLSLHPSVAPAYLREKASLSSSPPRVPVFVSHFLDFRNPGDGRRSLASISESERLAGFCLVCQRAFAEFPNIAESRVVGFVAAVRGRIQVLELFGTNDLLRSHFPPIVHALTYAAAAVELRAEKLGMSIPGRDDPARTLASARKEAVRLLETLAKSRVRKERGASGTLGDSFRIRNGLATGTALGLEGRLVHAVVYPLNPFEKALYSRPLDLPAERSATEEAYGELERREDRATLTEYEKRLLDRIRRRR